MEKEKKALCAVGTTSELMTHQTLLRHQPNGRAVQLTKSTLQGSILQDP